MWLSYNYLGKFNVLSMMPLKGKISAAAKGNNNFSVLFFQLKNMANISREFLLACSLYA